MKPRAMHVAAMQLVDDNLKILRSEDNYRFSKLLHVDKGNGTVVYWPT